MCIFLQDNNQKVSNSGNYSGRPTKASVQQRVPSHLAREVEPSETDNEFTFPWMEKREFKKTDKAKLFNGGM